MSSSQGEHSKIKCKSEAKAPQLIDYVQVLQTMMRYLGQSSAFIKVDIITDDINIQREIDRTVVTNMEFLKPEPAPKRIPDKVKFFCFEVFYNKLHF